MTEHTRMTSIDTASGQRWQLIVTRSEAGQSADGFVVLYAAPDGDSPHARLAGARAWSALGASRLATGDAEGAIRCADAGLEELGEQYRPPGVKDSTTLKIAAARERIEQGAAQDGASVLLDMLRVRSGLYLSRHQNEIGE